MIYTDFSAVDLVDAEKGIIYGVSVITIGPAKGHGLWVDETAINQILSLAKAKPDGVKVKAEHSGGVFDTSGKLVNFRKDGNQIRADLELLKSDENYAKVIEMARVLPNEFGLSVSTEAVSENIDGKKMVRFKVLESVDLVSTPAANPNGLFSVKHTNNKSMTIDKIQLAKLVGLDPEKATEEEIATEFAQLSKKMEGGKYKKEEESTEKDAESETKHEIKDKKKLKKLEGEMDGDGEAECEDDKKKGKFDAILASLLQLSAKIETIEGANKLSLEAAKKVEITGLIASASAEGKVVPLSDVQLMKMDMSDVKDLFSKLPKGQLKLSKSVQAGSKAVSFKSNEERVEFCRTQREAGAAQLTAQFAAAGLVQLN